MKRLGTLIIAGLITTLSLAQTCDTLVCTPGLVFTTYATEDGQCVWPIPATHFIDELASECPDVTGIAVYRAAEVESAGDQFTPEFTGRDTLWITPDDDMITVVHIYRELSTGEVQFCENYLLLQTSGSDCFHTPFAWISWYLGTEDFDGIGNVQVVVDNSSGSSVYLTDGSGGGAPDFPLLPADGPTIITPIRNDNPLNGVSTFDVVLVLKHIQGVQLIESPYKLIAADVNQSGTVSVLDAIQMRKLILNINSAFPNTNSWRFVDANHTFTDPTNPWSETFTETITLDPFGENGSPFAEFVGIKMGDVNGSAQTH